MLNVAQPLNSLRDRYSNDGFQRLSHSLNRVEQGNTEVYSTPLNEKFSPIMERVDEMFQRRSNELDAELLNLELRNKDNMGPRSIAIPFSERVPQLEVSYDSYKGKDPSDLADLIVDNPYLKKFMNRLRMISVQNASKLLKPQTGAGSPYFQKKGKVMSIALKDYSESDSVLFDDEPAVQATRTQGGKDNKTRTVWVVSILRILTEMRMFVPVLDVEKQLPWRHALRGPESVDAKVTSMFESMAANPKFSLLSIDFSHYDDSLKHELLNQVGKVTSRLFQRGDNIAVEDVFDTLSSMGLITPIGLLSGRHGMPSGSTFTNYGDSMVQYMVQSIIRGSIFSLDIQGDDGLYLTDNAELVMSNFKDYGLEVNEDKSHVSQEFCVYLQMYYSNRYTSRVDQTQLGGVYPIYRAANRLFQMERYQDFEDYDISGQSYFSLRALSILENTRNHPFFEEFVKIIWEFDKFQLAYQNSDLSRYQSRAKVQKGAGDLIANQYGDKSSGIEDFEVSKVIRGLES